MPGATTTAAGGPAYVQQTATGFNNTPYRDSFTGTPIVPAGVNSDAYFFGGFDPAALAAAMRASGATMRDNPLFLNPNGFQPRRQNYRHARHFS